MKKIICLIAVVVMIASVALAAGKMKIAPDKIGALKGTWEGTLTFASGTGTTCAAKLEILNDTVPVKGTFTIVNPPDAIAQMLGVTGGAHTATNDEGKITTQGSIMWAGSKNFFEFFLTGDKKGTAWFYFNGARGDVTLTKKK
jgi:hypothetical protein